jgi:hypothetical protein
MYLSENGFDVSEAEENLSDNHETSRLYPVKKDGIAYNVLCKSAKSGLLYLKSSSWEQLRQPNFMLYVLTGKDYDNCRLCQTKSDLIDKYAEYFVFRMGGDSNPDTLDKALAGTFNKGDMQILFMMKESKINRSIFGDIRKKEATDNYSSVSTEGENDI